ncbi:MAG TPA: M50 family metallopeptidase, partial [Opitutaceae bacterium]|nr:M50 family metallopeptidase [Opitutaceae bacterium]
FVCVVLHELGHSLTAMRFGVNVRRILLMPIGGVAEFDRIPRSPAQELLITVAGPSVNFTIAGLLWCAIKLSGGWEFAFGPWGDFVVTLLTWNIWVGLFNLIPAFPMDGGRIVRALLALKLPYLRATYWAVTLAKVVTIVGVPYAIYRENYFMAAIFVYIFMAGQAEYRAVKRRETDEALWRESLIRSISVPPATEPPVL